MADITITYRRLIPAGRLHVLRTTGFYTGRAVCGVDVDGQPDATVPRNGDVCQNCARAMCGSETAVS